MPDITKERKIEIEEKAKNILLKYNLSDAPDVDIVSIVKQDGFEVIPVLMPIDTTGCLLVNDDPNDYKRLIMVNKDFKNPDNENDIIFKKSRFITAHEYGHYILHKSPEKSLYAHRDSDKRNKEKELEADYFARAILMPLKPFTSFYNTVNDLSDGDTSFIIDMLSLIFNVSKNKINKRIEDMNILANEVI